MIMLRRTHERIVAEIKAEAETALGGVYDLIDRLHQEITRLEAEIFRDARARHHIFNAIDRLETRYRMASGAGEIEA